MKRAWIVVLALAGTSCRPESRTVSINFERILSAVPAAARSAIRTPNEPALGSVKLAVKPIAASSIRDPSNVQPVDLRRQIAEEQESLRKRLEARLRAVYAKQLVRFEESIRREAAADAQVSVLAFEARLYLALLDLAKRRSGPMARIALIEGYPDPNPKSVAPPTAMTPVQKIRFDDMVHQRALIESADAQYAKEVAVITAELSEQEKQLAEKIAKRLKAFKDELDAKAVSEAAAEVRSSPRELGLELTDAPALRIPARAAESIEFAASGAPRPPSQVTSSLDAEESQLRRRAVGRMLATWLAIRNFRLAPNGRDATDEFLGWLSNSKGGR